MSDKSERYIPASALANRLAKIRLKMASLSEQIDSLRHEEKVLASLLEEAVDASGSGSPPPAHESANGQRTRTRGIGEAIAEAVQSRPGLNRDGLVEGLRHLNLNPFDQNAARRIIINNLGNLIRSGKIRVNDDGELYPTDSVSEASE